MDGNPLAVGIDDYLEMMERWTRANGKHAGVELAEAFRCYKGHPYPESPLLEQLAGADYLPGDSQSNLP
jgi:hypothetical protein